MNWIVRSMKLVYDNVYVVKPYDPHADDCCVYMIDTKSEDGLVLIDVGLNIEPIQVIEKEGFYLKDIRNCLITHGHLDHFGACFKLKKFNENIKFYAHELDADQIEQKPTGQYIEQYYGDYKYQPVKLAKRIKFDNEILKFGKFEFRCIHIPGHTPGSVAYLLEIRKKKILFGGDLPGVVLNFRGDNLEEYLKSMQKLLHFNIDILCEGHEDIIEPAKKVKKFIKKYMKINQKLNLYIEEPHNVEILLDLILISCELEFFDNALDFCTYLLEIEPNNVKGQELLQKIIKQNPQKIDWIKNLINESTKK